MKQLVLVITEAETKEVLERWTFDIDTNKDVLEGKGWVRKPYKCFTVLQRMLAGTTMLNALARLFETADPSQTSLRRRSSKKFKPSCARFVLEDEDRLLFVSLCLAWSKASLLHWSCNVSRHDSCHSAIASSLHPVHCSQISASVSFLPLLESRCEYSESHPKVCIQFAVDVALKCKRKSGLAGRLATLRKTEAHLLDCSCSSWICLLLGSCECKF